MSGQASFVFAQDLPPGLHGKEANAARLLLGRRGRAAALPVLVLRTMLGVGERTAREIVERLVMEHGLFIVSDNDPGSGGYFVPDTREEARECIEKMRRAGVKHLARAARLARNGRMDELAGQLEIALQEVGDWEASA